MMNTMCINNNMETVISGGKAWKINWQKISVSIGKAWASVRNSLRKGSVLPWEQSQNGKGALLNQSYGTSCRSQNFSMSRWML